MSADSVKEILSSGTAPLELEYYTINDFNTSLHNTIGLRSVVRVNSTDLGTLYPEQYRVVSNRTAQSSKLAAWAFARFLEQAEDLINTDEEDFFITVYFPGRMITKPELDKLLASVPEEKKNLLSHLVCEFSSEVLIMGGSELKNALNDIKSKYGVKLMLSEYGDEFCPILRLSGLPFDYVVLDKSISSPENAADAGVTSVVQFINSLSMSSVLESVSSEPSSESGCDYYISRKPMAPKGAV